VTINMARSFFEISVSTPERDVFVDITKRVELAIAQAKPPFTGVISVFIPHTTAGVTINEGADPSVIHDMVESMRRFVPRDAGYRHEEGNSDAHIKASIMGSSVLVPVEQGRLRLGAWQSVYLAEFDGPRNRRVWIMPVTANDQGGEE
jgi:secondary thiamine-phosphate synthase enzyme